MLTRTKIITGSVAAHALAVFALYAASVWGLERLDGGKPRVTGVALLEVPPPAGGKPAVVRAEKIEPKRAIVRTLVQPVKQDVRSLVTVSMEPGTGTGTGTGTGDGNGDGPCVIEPCDAIGGFQITAPAVPAVTDLTLLPPDDVAALRISGETQIEPSPERRLQLGKLNKKVKVAYLTGVLELCVSSEGAVTSTKVARTTGYVDYDASLEAAVQRWRYRPYTVGGTPQPFCGTVQFNYRLDIARLREIDGYRIPD